MGYREDRLLATPVHGSKAKPANGAGWRLLIATLVLIAFTIQSFIAQTHIHVGAAASVGTKFSRVLDAGWSKVTIAGRIDSQDKAPANDDPLKCPLCQAVGYAGHFVAPSAAALLLPPNTISILPSAVTAVSPREIFSHSWQGRGPPNS